MRQSNNFDKVTIKQPCAKKWDEMTGDGEIRFCSHCSKDVHNLSAMTRRKAERLVAQSNGNLCIRFNRRDDGQIQTAPPQTFQITRRASQFAAGIFGLTIALTGAAHAQQQQPNPAQWEMGDVAWVDESKNKKSEGGSTSQVVVRLFDSQGAAIPYLIVKLVNQETKQEFAVTTNEDGAAFFKELKFGGYELSVDGQIGYESVDARIIELKTAVEPELTLTLEDNKNPPLMGTMIYLPPQSEIPLLRAAGNGDVEAVKILIADGAKVNAADEKLNEKTALHLAVTAGNLEIAQMLLNAGANVNAVDKDGRTPLLLLDYNAPPELARLLLERGADPNAQDTLEARTALMDAVEDDRREIIGFLLEFGANPNLQNNEGSNALSFANNEDVETLLKKHGAKEN